MRMRGRASRTCLPVLIAFALVVACGGPSGPSGSSGASKKKAATSKRDASGKRGASAQRARGGKRSERDRSDRAAARERRNEEKQERKLRRQQSALCERVCDRLIECQIRYARENLTPDIVEAMEKPAERKKMRAKCREERAACDDDDPDEEDLARTGGCLRKKSCAASIQCLDS